MTNPQFIPHSDASNFSFLSPEAQKDIEAVKDEIKAGHREQVDQEVQDAIDEILSDLDGGPDSALNQ